MAGSEGLETDPTPSKKLKVGDTNSFVENPLLEDVQFPRFDAITPDHICDGITTLLRNLEEDFTKLENMIELEAELPWSKVVMPFTKIVEQSLKPYEIVNLLINAKDSKQLRDAFAVVMPKKVKFDMRLSQSKAVYKAFKTIQESHNWEAMSDAQKRIVEMHIKESELNGINLDDAEMVSLRDIEEELEIQYTSFGQNLLDGRNTYEKLVTDEDTILGLPNSILYWAAERARSKGHEEATFEMGPWLFTLDDYHTIQEYAVNRYFRKEFHLAHVTSLSNGDFDNIPVIKSILDLRWKKAKLLGYNNYAEVSMKTKCATIEKAKHLLEELQNKLWEAGLEEIEELKRMARAENAEEADNFMPWDTAFWTRVLLETKLPGYKDNKDQYYTFPNVMGALFHLSDVLFEIQIAEVDATDRVWHKSVKLYSVSDVHTTIGHIYFDPFYRPEKMDVAATGGFFSRSVDPKFKRQPMAFILCNLGPEMADDEIRMDFLEVRTVFHEFGHAFQHVLTKQDELLVAGFKNIEQDCVEVPSNFMEKWCYYRDTFTRIAGGANLQRLKDIHPICEYLEEINTAAVDLEFHTSYSPSKSECIHTMFLRSKQLIPLHDHDRSFCTWNHIFGGGYEAAMYGYQWSDLFSADAFSAFEDAGWDGEKVLTTKGRKFRDSILSVGGGKAPEKVLEDFLGRQPTVDALVKHKLSLIRKF